MGQPQSHGPSYSVRRVLAVLLAMDLSVEEPVIRIDEIGSSSTGLKAIRRIRSRSENHWSVPLNLSFSQLTKLGKLPVSLSGGLRYWAESPADSPEGWGFRFSVTLLFPK